MLSGASLPSGADANAGCTSSTGSHPCAAVEKAMSIKGPSYDVTEWPPTLQQRADAARAVRRAHRPGAEAGRQILGIAGDHAPAS